MKKDSFKNLCKNKIVLLDGAVGSELAKMGMPNGICPEYWAIHNRNSILQLQTEHIESGSDIIYAFTFGANRLKLQNFGLEGQVYQLNKELVELSKEAVKSANIQGRDVYVAGCLSPTGKLIQPLGEYCFEEIVSVYKEQVKGLLDGGADLIVVETMLNISEARAAILAVKEICPHLPVMVTVTFEQNGRTLTGTTPEAVVVTLQSLGIDAVGVNCSTGPDDMVELVGKMKEYAVIPIIAKPNAGIPFVLDGQTTYSMNPSEFCSYTKSLVEAGAGILGGCCGTSKEYIRGLYHESKSLSPPDWNKQKNFVLSGPKTILDTGKTKSTLLIGESINPTGKKELSDAISNEDYDELLDLAMDQADQGSRLIDLNIAVPGINEKHTLTQVLNNLMYAVDVPLCFDSTDHQAIEAALRIYPGRGLINSIANTTNSLNSLLPIAAKYGTPIIAMPMDDTGIPETVEGRMECIVQICEKAMALGIPKEDIIGDCLVMPLTNGNHYISETLQLIDWCKNDYKIKTVIGLSNISYGMKNRSMINAAFLSMAIARGLDFVIANSFDDLIIQTMEASDLILGKSK